MGRSRSAFSNRRSMNVRDHAPAAVPGVRRAATLEC